MKPIVDRASYSRSYAAGRYRAQREAAYQPQPAAEPATTTAGFDTPAGRRITLLLPIDVTADDLDYLEDALGMYLTLYRRRLADWSAPPNPIPLPNRS